MGMMIIIDNDVTFVRRHYIIVLVSQPFCVLKLPSGFVCCKGKLPFLVSCCTRYLAPMLAGLVRRRLRAKACDELCVKSLSDILEQYYKSSGSRDLWRLIRSHLWTSMFQFFWGEEMLPLGMALKVLSAVHPLI